MPSKTAPGAIPPTVKTLQSLLTRIGSATSGKKDSLIPRLAKDLKAPSRISKNETSTRILSIDMGIKNLAFCVADIETESTRVKSRDADQGLKMRIQAWRKLNVAEEVEKSKPDSSTGVKAGEGKAGEEEIDEAYSPASLSHTAYALLTKTLLPYTPDIILIERQRWRSAGGAAIQQWTVRVNTLEGMLWAILTALRAETSASRAVTKATARTYEIFGVDPKRVGQFWVGGDQPELKKTRSKVTATVDIDAELEGILVAEPKSGQKLGRAKAEKKAKINLLRSWLTPENANTSPPSAQQSADLLGLRNPSIAFSFSDDAEQTREALCKTEKAKGGRRTKSEGIAELKKLDDVTDSFLQAAAWVTWEQNRMRIGEEWNEVGGRLKTAFQDVEDSDATTEKRVKKTRAARKTSEEVELKLKRTRKPRTV